MVMPKQTMNKGELEKFYERNFPKYEKIKLKKQYTKPQVSARTTEQIYKQADQLECMAVKSATHHTERTTS